MRAKKVQGPTKSEKLKLKKAKKNFDEMWKKIAPFIKKKEFKERFTTGKWETPTYAKEI